MTAGDHVNLRIADHVALISALGDGYTFTCEKSTIERDRTYTFWKANVDIFDDNHHVMYVHVWDGKVTSSSILR